MTDAGGNVDGQLTLLLPPNGGGMPTRPSDLGLFEPAPIPLDGTLAAPHAAERMHRFRFGGSEFCAAVRRLRGVVDADSAILVVISRTSVTLIARADPDITYYEEYSAATVGVPVSGLMFAIRFRLLASLGAIEAAAEVSVDLEAGRIVGRLGTSFVRQGPLVPITVEELPYILTPVAVGSAGAGHELSRALSHALQFSARDDKNRLNRVVVGGGAARASCIHALIELRNGQFGQVPYEIGLRSSGVVIKALGQLPSAVSVLSNGGQHIVGGEGRVVAWLPPQDRAEPELLNATRFKSATSLLFDRQELCRTLAIFGVGLVAGKARIGLRLVRVAEKLALWVESNHANGIVCSHEHEARLEGEPLSEMPAAFYLDHMMLEQVLGRGDADEARLDLKLGNGAVTAVRFCTSDATYLLGATTVASVTEPQQRRHRSR